MLLYATLLSAKPPLYFKNLSITTKDELPTKTAQNKLFHIKEIYLKIKYDLIRLF